MPEQKQQQENISAGEGSNLREQGKSSTIQDKSGKCITKEICSELYNYERCEDNEILVCIQFPDKDLQPILHEEVEIAVASLIKGEVCRG